MYFSPCNVNFKIYCQHLLFIYTEFFLFMFHVVIEQSVNVCNNLILSVIIKFTSSIIYFFHYWLQKKKKSIINKRVGYNHLISSFNFLMVCVTVIE